MKASGCPDCYVAEEFESRQKLDEHVRLFHTPPTAAPCCYICGKVFETRPGLENHGRTKHRNFYEVFCKFDFCRRVFMLKSELKEHKVLCRQIHKRNQIVFNQAKDQEEENEEDEEELQG